MRDFSTIVLGGGQKIPNVLYEWSHSEHDEALRREVGEMERRLSELLNECDTKIQHLSDLDVKGVLPEIVLKDVEEGEMSSHQPKGLPWVTYSKIL